MRQSNLLLINTAAVYLRMLLTVPMGLLMVRFTYGELEEIDYGLWGTIGASTALMSVITSSLVTSAQRHLAYQIGTTDQEQRRSLFQTVLATFWASGCGLLLIGLVLAPTILARLTIPPDRYDAAWWVLHLSLSSLVLSTCLVPYRAILAANQSIVLTSTAELLLSVLSLANAWSLRFVAGDKLVFFAAVQAVILPVAGFYLAFVAMRRHPESRVLPWFASLQEAAGVARFALWSFFSNISGMLRVNGVVILVNSLFGPGASAAAFLGGQAQGYLVQAAQSFNRSISPAMSTQAGKQNQEMVDRLMNFGCKLPAFSGALLFVPFVFETEMLLDLWQKLPVPADTATHARWLCGMALLGIMTWGQQLALEAKDRISGITRALLGSVALTLVVGALGCHYYGWPAWSLSMLICLTTGVFSLIVRPWFVANALGSGWWGVTRSSVAPSFLAMAPGLLLAAPLLVLLPPSPTRVLAVTLVNSVALGLAAWFLGFNNWERQVLREAAQRVLARLTRRPTPS